MNVLVILVPVSIFLSGVALAAFLWSLRANQYEDMEGDAQRILLDPTGVGDHDTAAVSEDVAAEENEDGAVRED